MFSIIIPTMWRSNLTMKLLSELQESHLVNEIVLIDNDPTKTPDLSGLTKIKYLTKGHNIYVNPAWNWGVAQASNELIGICNDDLTFNVNATLDLVSKNQHKLGCFGMHKLNFKEDADAFSFIKTDENQRPTGEGFGCLMFLKKSNWIEIPNNLKIWFGDDWIIKTNQPVHILRFKEMLGNEGYAITSSDTKFSKQVQEDINTWIRIFGSW